jgi:hypothetical protein
MLIRASGSRTRENFFLPYRASGNIYFLQGFVLQPRRREQDALWQRIKQSGTFAAPPTSER